MLKDAQGLAVATDRPETIAAIDTFVATALAYGTDYQPIIDAAEADPTCVMAGSLAASLMMWMEAGQSPQLARPYLNRCREAVMRAEPREGLWFQATEAWVAGDLAAAMDLLEQITERWPRDVFAMKLAQYHYFNLGWPEKMLAINQKVLPANEENGFLYGCLAFCLEQTHDMAGAEAAGRRAVEINRADPWAHHAVAHVMEMQGRIGEGVAWMAAHSDTWEGCNSFMLGHNWWHTALFHLDFGDVRRVRKIHDEHVWGLDKTYSQDQASSASLLWRMEIRGIDVGDRWQDLADHVAGRTREHVQPFLDLHYLYALARAGRGDKVDEMLASMAAHAAEAPALARSAWEEVAVPAARGIAAYARGDYEGAHADLSAVTPRLQEIGGSHAQRDLFVHTWLDTLLRTHRGGEAVEIFEARAKARPSVPYGFDLLERAQAQA
ncbi:MAG: tetratricopeptide repeat protein [Alphaproteobacteria bacterium]|jgi:tetratricopeptide (TPR) repeat protein|nr:tetratricopeptide repeat protein [Alphaproteobacteria bacterium]MDP6832136.1 tetratricopeptide repeat protein [Alphaproteobacteria bacterium]MDP6872139.1 tetratricopeptide repeat protein [Alphaproteobacteria bacterium]